MVWTTIDEKKLMCEKWIKEPLINPQTGHDIVRNGPTFMQWKKLCGKPSNEHTTSFRKCQEWRNNPSVNPDTGKTIKFNGPTYKMWEKECKIVRERDITLSGDYYIPDAKGMVPCVQDSDTMYIVRTFMNHKVYGPLNKHAKNIVLHYFKYTWDYRNNHYKPIFINNQVPPPPAQLINHVKKPVKNINSQNNNNNNNWWLTILTGKK